MVAAEMQQPNGVGAGAQAGVVSKVSAKWRCTVLPSATTGISSGEGGGGYGRMVKPRALSARQPANMFSPVQCRV